MRPPPSHPMTYTKEQLDEAEAFTLAMLRYHEAPPEVRIVISRIQEASQALTQDSHSIVESHRTTLKIIAGLRLARPELEHDGHADAGEQQPKSDADSKPSGSRDG